MIEWNITKNSKRCLSCDKGFKENDEFFSALYESGELFVRKDFCPNCWDENDKKFVFSFWRFRVSISNDPPKSTINTDMMLDLFFKLESVQDAKSKLNLRYVLALFLIRKRILKLQKSKHNESDLLTLSYPKEARIIKLQYPRMTEEEVDSTTNEVKALLDTPHFTLN